MVSNPVEVEHLRMMATLTHIRTVFQILTYQQVPAATTLGA